MSYGTWGFIGGAAKAGEKFGEEMMKDEFEKRREERLEKARMEMEQNRRKWAREDWEYQRQAGHQDRFGARASQIPERGTLGIENDISIENQYGPGADPTRGSVALAADADVDLHGRKARAGYEAGQFGAPTMHDQAGLVQRGPDGKMHTIGTGAGAPGSASATDRAASEAQLLSQYKEWVTGELRPILPGSDIANMTMIQAHGGFEGWSPKYRESVEKLPDYYTWRRNIHGIELPPGMREGNAATGARQGEQTGILGGAPEAPAAPAVPTTNREAAQSKIGQVWNTVTNALGGGRKDETPGGAAGVAGAGTEGNPVKVNSPEELDQYPSGTYFVGPDGVIRRKR